MLSGREQRQKLHRARASTIGQFALPAVRLLAGAGGQFPRSDVVLQKFSMPWRLIAAVTFISSLAFALIWPLPIYAQGTQPKDVMDVYRQITRDLTTDYPQTVCRHPLHVVLALDTSGSMNLNKFHEIWDNLLTYYFKPGDTFTLLPFHTHVLTGSDPQAPKPANRDYPTRNEEMSVLRGWFTDPRYREPDNVKGTSLHLAQQGALQTAQELTRDNSPTQDKTHAILVLLFTDSPISDADAKSDKLADEAAARTLPDILSHFRQPGEKSVTNSFPNKPYSIPLGNNKFCKLVLFHASMIANAVPVASPARKIYLKSTDVPSIPSSPSEADPREAWSVWSLIFLIACPLLLLFAKGSFHVKYEKGQGDNEKTLNVGQAGDIYSRDSGGQPNRNEVYLLLTKSTAAPVKLCTIHLWGLGRARVQASSNAVLLEGEPPTQRSFIEIRYGHTKTFKVARTADPEDFQEISVSPHAWLHGKERPLIMAGLAGLACLFFFARTAFWEAPMPHPLPLAPETEDVCAP